MVPLILPFRASVAYSMSWVELVSQQIELDVVDTTEGTPTI